MNLFNRLESAISSAPDHDQLDRFIDNVRESYENTNKQFNRYGVLLFASITIYYLVISGEARLTSFSSIQLNDVNLFRRTFLVFPAALFAGLSCIGYLRILQRDTYDFLMWYRFHQLADLNVLQLPGDYVLGAFLLKEYEGWPGWLLANIIIGLASYTFAVIPFVYVVNEAVANIRTFGTRDHLVLLSSTVALMLSLCGFSVIILSIIHIRYNRAILDAKIKS